MALNIRLVLQAVLEEYALPLGGAHGVAHWARVLENGVRLADATGANVEVVQLFALLHDSRRRSESIGLLGTSGVAGLPSSGARLSFAGAAGGRT